MPSTVDTARQRQRTSHASSSCSRGYGLEGGTAGAVTNANPSSSIFLRLDAPIPRWNSRITLRGNYGHGDSSIFARPTALAPTNCPTERVLPAVVAAALALGGQAVDRLATHLQSSERRIQRASRRIHRHCLRFPADRQAAAHPRDRAWHRRRTGRPASRARTRSRPGSGTGSWTTELTDNLSIPVGAHRIGIGVSTQSFDLRAFQLRGAYGVWEFASLDSLQSGRGVALSRDARYRERDRGVRRVSRRVRRRSVGCVAPPDVHVRHSRRPVGALGATALRGRRRLDVRSSHGLRAVRRGRVVAAASASTIDLTGDGDPPIQLRGGAGLFTGRPPMFWLFGGFSAYGLAARTLQCGSLRGDAGAAPAFRPTSAILHSPVRAARRSAARPRERSTSSTRICGSRRRCGPRLALDAQLPFGVVGTLEGLVTRTRRAIVFSPINLAAPVAADLHDRVMYGTIDAAGAATPRRVSLPGWATSSASRMKRWTMRTTSPWCCDERAAPRSRDVVQLRTDA